jgi:hypothetical protein
MESEVHVKRYYIYTCNEYVPTIIDRSLTHIIYKSTDIDEVMILVAIPSNSTCEHNEYFIIDIKNISIFYTKDLEYYLECNKELKSKFIEFQRCLRLFHTYSYIRKITSHRNINKLIRDYVDVRYVDIH